MELSPRVRYTCNDVSYLLTRLVSRVLERTSTPFSHLEPFVIPYTQPQPPEDESQWVSDEEGSSPESPRTESFKSAETGEDFVLDLENPTPSAHAELPCPQAIEFLANIKEESAQNNEITTQADIGQAIKVRNGFLIFVS